MRTLAIAAATLFLFGCGGRDSADDQGLHQDIVNSSSGAEVTFDAVLVSEPGPPGFDQVMRG